MSKKAFNIYNIKEVPGILPSITCILRVDSHPTHNFEIKRWASPLWILDYNRNLSVPVRVGSTRKPWRVREAQIAHMYPPNTPFWEDFREAHPGISGMAFFFQGGDQAGLRELIPPKQYYAKFHDVEGKLWGVLKRISFLPEQFGDSCFAALQSSLWDVIDMLQRATYQQNEDYIIQEASHIELEETFSRQVEQHMRLHYAEKLSLKSIADALRVSPATLRGKFHKEQKTSPMARLNEIRIDIAKSSLLQGEKLSNIAAQVGFYDEFHFSKAFKKSTSQSPREYLQSLQK